MQKVLKNTKISVEILKFQPTHPLLRLSTPKQVPVRIRLNFKFTNLKSPRPDYFLAKAKRIARKFYPAKLECPNFRLHRKRIKKSLEIQIPLTIICRAHLRPKLHALYLTDYFGIKRDSTGHITAAI